MTDERRAEIKERAEAATPGPWVHEMRGQTVTADDGLIDVADACTGDGYVCDQGVADADFIADARTAIPELIAEVERLREHVATLEHAYKDSRDRIRELEKGVVF